MRTRNWVRSLPRSAHSVGTPWRRTAVLRRAHVGSALRQDIQKTALQNPWPLRPLNHHHSALHRTARTVLLLFHTVSICTLLGSLGLQKRNLTSVPQRSETTEDERQTEEKRSIIPPRYELLAEFRDALVCEEPPSSVWESYVALRHHERTFFTREDFADLLKVVAELPALLAMKACLKVFGDMRLISIAPLAEEYDTAMAICRKARNIKVAESLVSESAAKQLTLLPSTYANIIEMYGALRDIDRAKQSYHDMLARGRQPTAAVFSALMSAFCASGRLQDAESLFNQMSRMQLRPTTHTYASLMEAYRKLGKVDAAMELFEQMPAMGVQPNVKIYTIISRGCYSVGDRETVSRLLRQMRLCGIQPDVVYYGAMIAEVAGLGDFQEVDRLIKEAQESQVAMNTILYDGFLAGHARHSSLNETLGTVDEMVKIGMDPGAFTLNSMLVAYGRAGDAAGAVALVDAWKKSGRIVNAVNYATLLNLHAKNFGVPAALDFLRELLEGGTQGDAGMFNAILGISLKRGDVSGSQEVLREIHKWKVPPNVVTYNTLMTHVSDIGALGNIMEEAQRQGIEFDSVSFRIILSKLARAKDSAGAYSVFQKMKSLGLMPDREAWTAFADAYGKTGEIHRMEDVVNQMEADGWSLDTVLYTCLVDAYVRLGDVAEAEKIWARMISLGKTPTAISYAQLLKGYVRIGNHDAAWKLVKNMEASGLPLDRVIYTQLMRSIGQTLGHSGAMKIFQQMVDSGIEPDTVTYNTLLNMKADCGVKTRLFRDMLGRGLRPDTYTYQALFKSDVRSDQRRIVDSVCDQLAQHCISLDRIFYQELFKAQLWTRDVKGMVVTWSRIATSEGLPTAQLLAACIRGLAKCGMNGARPALAIWDASQELHGEVDASIRKTVENLRAQITTGENDKAVTRRVIA